jgi:hypothetical protein
MTLVAKLRGRGLTKFRGDRWLSRGDGWLSLGEMCG